MTATRLAEPPLRDIRLPADPSELWRARRFAEAAAEAFGFDDDDSYAFKFAASEAVANAIEHGEPCPGGNILLRIGEEGAALSFYVRDCGRFIARSDPDDDDRSRGRGLMFMEHMVDDVEVKPAVRGTVVRLTKRRV